MRGRGGARDGPRCPPWAIHDQGRCHAFVQREAVEDSQLCRPVARTNIGQPSMARAACKCGYRSYGLVELAGVMVAKSQPSASDAIRTFPEDVRRPFGKGHPRLCAPARWRTRFAGGAQERSHRSRAAPCRGLQKDRQSVAFVVETQRLDQLLTEHTRTRWRTRKLGDEPIVHYDIVASDVLTTSSRRLLALSGLEPCSRHACTPGRTTHELGAR